MAAPFVCLGGLFKLSKGQWITVLDTYPIYIGHDTATAPVYGIANTIGWEPVISCVGFSTEKCRSVCYADKHKKIFKGVRDTLASNWKSVTSIQREHGVEGLTEAFSDVLRSVADNIDQTNVKRAKKGLKPLQKRFRWTWSGEIWSKDCAKAIVLAHAANPDITGWAYTRALPHIDALIPGIKAKQLRIMLSQDEENEARVEATRQRVMSEYGVHLATFRMRDTEGLKGVACPKVDDKERFALAKKGGQISPCIRCGMCVDVDRKPIDIVVSIH